MDPQYPQLPRPGAPAFPPYAVLDRDNLAASNMWTVGRLYMSLRGARYPWNVGAGAAAAAVQQLRPNVANWIRPADF